MLRRRLNIVFRDSNTSNSEVNGPIWPEFELIRDFRCVLAICKFKKDPIKTKQAMLRKRSNIFGTQMQLQIE